MVGSECKGDELGSGGSSGMDSRSLDRLNLGTGDRRASFGMNRGETGPRSDDARLAVLGLGNLKDEGLSTST